MLWSFSPTWRRAARRRLLVVPPVHRTSFILKLHYETTCRPFDAPDIDLPPDEHVALEAGALGRIYPLLCRLAQLMALVHALADGLPATEAGRPSTVARAPGPISRSDLPRRRDAGPRQATSTPSLVSDSRSDWLASVSSSTTTYEGTAGARRSASQRRHMLDMMRLDDAYRRFRRARRPGVEIGVYRRIATLWAIVDEHLERARVDLPVTLQSLSDEFRRKRGLERRAATLAWRRANDLDRRGYERLVAMDARLALVSAGSQAHALGLRPATDPTCWLVDAIRLVGLYARLKRRVSRADAGVQE